MTRYRCSICGQFETDTKTHVCKQPVRHREPIMLRVWRHVEKRGPDECWPWTGVASPAGYGMVGGSADPNRGYVHVKVLEDALGRPLLPEMHALHTCDNPPCCNPAHLWEGTTQDNQTDMVTKGRSNKGERHWNAKLTATQIEEIRHDPRPSSTVAPLYGVAPRQIRRVRQGARWR
jgi:hypothetical protein